MRCRKSSNDSDTEVNARRSQNARNSASSTLRCCFQISRANQYLLCFVVPWKNSSSFNVQVLLLNQFVGERLLDERGGWSRAGCGSKASGLVRQVGISSTLQQRRCRGTGVLGSGQVHMRERAAAYVPLALESLHLQPPAKLIQRPRLGSYSTQTSSNPSGPRIKAHSAHGP